MDHHQQYRPRSHSKASGVVLTTVENAAPFVQPGKPFSLGPLALVVLCVEQALPATSLHPVPVQFPVECITNDEPLLVSGYMYEVGAGQVVRAKPDSKLAVKSVATCVVKAMLYRDQCLTAWENVVANPMRTLLSMMPSVQACDDDDECSGMCEMWHPAEGCDVLAPVLEIWGRQSLNDQFELAPASKATLFTVHIRVPLSVQLQLQMYSG